jgi:hypothetical protein
MWVTVARLRVLQDVDPFVMSMIIIANSIFHSFVMSIFMFAVHVSNIVKMYTTKNELYTCCEV